MFRRIGSGLLGTAASFGVSSACAETTSMMHEAQQAFRFTDADGKEVTRPYTPITKPDHKGSFELLVKKYDGGKMSSHLHNMKVGETLDVKGPYRKIKIEPNQVCEWTAKKKKNNKIKYTHLGLIAGGTGVTPMYQVLRHLLDSPEDKTAISMLYANKSPQDILLSVELEHMSRSHHRFNLYNIVETAPANWTQGIGYVNSSMVKSFMPKPGEGRILVCGPPGMMKAVSGDKDYNSTPPKQGPIGGILKDEGYSSKDVFKF